MSVSFFVSGEPKAQPRPRAFARNFGGKWQARVYDAKSAENWKSLIAVAAAGLFKQPIQGPVLLILNFWMPRPKAHYRSNGELKEASPRWHTSKPDADNLEKAVMDALTQIGAWRDDSQVAQKNTHKQYTDAAPGCYVQIEALSSERVEKGGGEVSAESDYFCDKCGVQFSSEDPTSTCMKCMALAIREKALQDIKAIHTRWYRGDMTADEAVREMEAIAVGVWMKEESISPKPTKDGETPCSHNWIGDTCELNEAQELINRQGKGIIDAAHQLSIATNELQQAKQQILMDTECIERIRTAGEKAEAKLDDVKGEVEKLKNEIHEAYLEGHTEGYNIGSDNSARYYTGGGNTAHGTIKRKREEEWLSSRARRVVEGKE